METENWKPLVDCDIDWDSNVQSSDCIVATFSTLNNIDPDETLCWKGKTVLPLQLEGLVNTIEMVNCPCQFQLIAKNNSRYAVACGNDTEKFTIISALSQETEHGNDKLMFCPENIYASLPLHRNGVQNYIDASGHALIQNAVDFSQLQMPCLLFDGFLTKETLNDISIEIKKCNIYRQGDGLDRFLYPV